MAYASTVPTALRALAALVTSVMPDDTLPAYGAIISGSGKQIAVLIAYDDGMNPAVDQVIDVGDIALVRQMERYNVTNAIIVRHGGQNLPAAIDTAYARLALIGAGLTADKTLGHAVITARIVAAHLLPAQGPKGAEAHLRFIVQIAAQTAA